jgi:hypothetical protein
MNKLSEYVLEGYVIVPPLSPWDEKHASKIIPDLAYRSFHITSAGAWSQHCQTAVTDLNFSKKVQAWHDRGYRLKKARLIIEAE